MYTHCCGARLTSYLSVFASDLRLQLLEPWLYPELLDTLYGLLMTLPQTEAFTVLRRRLDCVPSHRRQQDKYGSVIRERQRH